MLVVDASLVVNAVLIGSGLRELGDDELVAPPLLWPETRSSLHQIAWRGDLPRKVVERARTDLASMPVTARDPDRLADVAWDVADELGWAKTYDAEFIALARILGCRLVTADARLRRGADRLGFVVGPTEL